MEVLDAVKVHVWDQRNVSIGEDVGMSALLLFGFLIESKTPPLIGVLILDFVLSNSEALH